MAQADTTKANKLAYLHVRIVQQVLRNLLQFIVTLYLIEHLITDVPGCFVVHRDINHAIHALNQSRRESNTAIVTGVGDIFFEDQLEKVQQLLTTICRSMNDISLQLEVQWDIERLRLTSFGNDETVLDEYREHYEKEKSSRKAVTAITNEQRNFHQTIAKVAILHEGNASDQSAEQRTEPLRLNDMYPVQVTDAVLELVVQTTNITGNCRISRDIVNIVNNQEDSAEPSALRERRDEIRAAITNTFSYYGDFYAKQGCVQICVKPRSVKLLFELFEDCVSGEIPTKLKPLEELIRGITNFETYTQKVVLYLDHYESVMNKIVLQISHQFKERGLSLPNESSVPRVQLSQKGTILVRAPCPSVDEREQFENTFKSGYMNELFKPLEEILSAAYGEKIIMREMAQSCDVKANILVHMHERITRQCLLPLLEFAVTESRPVDTPSEAWTFDHFLNYNLPKITSTTTGQRNIKLLVPGFGVRLNISSWPLYLISFIIVDISGDNVVPAEIKEKVRRMARRRAELYNNLWNISDDVYDYQVQDFLMIMKDICQYLQRTDLLSSIEKDIENIVQGNIALDPRNIKVFQDHQEMEKSYRDNIKQFTAEEESYHSRIEEVISILEHHHLDDLTRDTLPVVIELAMTSCGNPEQRGRLDRELINILNNKEHPKGHQQFLQDKESVRKAFDKVFSGIGEFSAKSGCIQIIVRPKNIAQFFRLLNACVKGVLTEEMKPIQDIIRNLPGCNNYEQEAVLYRDHYTCAMDNLVSQLTAMVQTKGLIVPKRTTTKPMPECGKLIMKVGCVTLEDR